MLSDLAYKLKFQILNFPSSILPAVRCSPAVRRRATAAPLADGGLEQD